MIKLISSVRTLRARCIYRHPLVMFEIGKYYGFVKYADFTSFSVYKTVTVEPYYATRLLDECCVMVIEGKEGLIAVFEVC